MPKMFRERIYFDLREASAQMGVSLGTMTRWALEGERHLNDAIEVYREGNKLFVSQSSLKRAVGSELRWAEPVDAHGNVRTSQGSSFASCFISYSTIDQEFANHLFTDLQASGVRCWFAPHHIAGGKKVAEQIDDAIRSHERLLLILSASSMASEWVRTEIAKARKRELQEQRRVLFPLRIVSFDFLRGWECFDSDTGKDSAREIREYFIPDFSHWKDHRSYREAFDRLVNDLTIDH